MLTGLREILRGPLEQQRRCRGDEHRSDCVGAQGPGRDTAPHRDDPEPRPGRPQPHGAQPRPVHVNAVGLAVTEQGTEAVRRYLGQVADALAPDATGTVFAHFVEGPQASVERIRSAYSDSECDRLVTLKRQLDPSNLFRFNRNITPLNS